MAEQAVAHGAEGAHQTSTGISNTKLAMWTFLGSECLLFGALISTFLLYRTNTPPGAVTPHEIFDIPFTSVSSFVLLMSSLTMVLAVAAIQAGDHHKTRVWLLATALLGTVFISGQVFEFTAFVREGFTVGTSPAGSAFFILTSFHGAHVTLGIVMLMSLFGLSLQGQLPTERAEAVEYVGLYWHFVDIVWVGLFATIYIVG